MEAKPIVHVPDDVHLTYDGIHEYIKHEDHLITPPPTALTPIEEVGCECNEFNTDCPNCQQHAYKYALYLERLNVSTNSKLKEVTEAYNSFRSAVSEKLYTNYVSGLNTGIVLGSTATAVFTVATVYILKYFKRI